VVDADVSLVKPLPRTEQFEKAIETAKQIETTTKTVSNQILA